MPVSASKAPDDWGGDNLLTEGAIEGLSYSEGSEIELKGGSPRIHHGHAHQELGWDKRSHR